MASAKPEYQPFIVAPPFTSCEKSFIVYGQGSPPFVIFPIASGAASGESLEEIPFRPNAGVFEWTVDFDPGANITWALVDGKGQKAFSVPRVVQIGAVTHCAKNTYAKPSNHLGAILGGVLGALAVLGLLFLLYFFRKRIFPRRRPTASNSIKGSREPSPEPLPGSGLARAGTYNLAQRGVTFNTTELDHQATSGTTSPPPTYAANHRDTTEIRDTTH